ncbi:MAG TPA: dTDP-4-dehydrorhamnose reductase [Candidatus Binatia bacterium]|nr:dTDP-4-dehydrorhamnose reductase [Candidatus Binatia bacterium]
MRHVVVLGANGQLGTDLRTALRRVDLTPFTHADLDVCDRDRVRTVITSLRPDIVINTCAFHKVDVCEDEPTMSFAVNATAAYELARLAREQNFTLIHFSTDYVFDGRSRTPYTEDACSNPLSVYGVSKLAGELLIRAACPRHYVIRTTGLYGLAGASGKGGNFVETMIRLGKSGNPVRVVNDQVMTPTATADLAAAVATLIDRDGSVPYGLFHVTSAGQCSWHEFAKTIFGRCGMRVDLSPITTAESGAKATRPAYSVLDHGAWMRAGLQELRPWPDALDEYLRAKGHISQ